MQKKQSLWKNLECWIIGLPSLPPSLCLRWAGRLWEVKYGLMRKTGEKKKLFNDNISEKRNFAEVEPVIGE